MRLNNTKHAYRIVSAFRHTYGYPYKCTRTYAFYIIYVIVVYLLVTMSGRFTILNMTTDPSSTKMTSCIQPMIALSATCRYATRILTTRPTNPPTDQPTSYRCWYLVIDQPANHSNQQLAICNRHGCSGSGGCMENRETSCSVHLSEFDKYGGCRADTQTFGRGRTRDWNI